MTSPKHNWLPTALQTICSLITDGTHHSPPNTPNGDFPYITAKNIKRHGVDTSIDLTFVSKEVHEGIYARCPVEFEDVLYIKDGATTGIAAINHLKEPFSMLSSVALIKPERTALDPYFLKHWLNSPETYKQFTGKMTGTAIRRVVLKQIREADIALPPLAEQKQIAAKLDELLAQVDTLKARLDATPAILKRFRQSVLAAAVSGRLTEGWRDENPKAKLTPDLYRKAIKDIGFKLKAKDQTAPSPSEAIASWIDLSLGQIISVQSGDGLTSKEMIDGPIPVYGGNGINGYHNVANVSDATIVIGRVGYYCGAVHLTPKSAWVTDNALIVSYPEKLIDKSFAVLLLQATNLRQDDASTAQPVISGSKIYPIRASLPPIEEQTEIVRRVEQLFAFAEQIEERVRDAQARVNHLTQSILAKAFRGELTADWRTKNPELISGDNSAEALLARIRAGRANDTGRKTRGRRATP